MINDKLRSIVSRNSGVTRVGDTWGGNWRCHPYFFLKKTDDLFSHRRLQSDDILAIRPRLSTVLSKFIHIFSTLERVTRGGPP